MVDFTELLAGNGQFEVLFLTGHDGNPVCILAPESLPENFIVRRSDAPVTEKPVELRRTMSVTVRREGADSTKLDEGGIEWIIKSLLERQRSLKKARQRELEENEKEQLDIGEKLEEDGSDTVFNDTSNIATSVVDSTSPLVQLMDDSIAPEVGPMPNFSLLTGESRDYLVESPATENTLEEAFSQYENWRIEIPALPTCKNGCSNYHCEQAKSTTQVEYGPIMRPTKLAPLITTDLENSEDAYRKAFIQDEGILSIGRLSRSKTASPVPSADTATTTPTTTRAESNIRDIISTIQVKEMEKVPLLCMDPTRGSTMSSIDIIADELDLKSQILLDLVRGSESDAGSSPICQTTTQEFTIMENLKDEAAILETSIEDIAVSPTVSLESGTKVMKDIICKFFNSKSGCARGTSCIYRHQTTSSNDRPSRATTETSLDAATPVNSETSIDGAVIAKEVPKPKGVRIPQWFLFEPKLFSNDIE